MITTETIAEILFDLSLDRRSIADVTSENNIEKGIGLAS